MLHAVESVPPSPWVGGECDTEDNEFIGILVCLRPRTLGCISSITGKPLAELRNNKPSLEQLVARVCMPHQPLIPPHSFLNSWTKMLKGFGLKAVRAVTDWSQRDENKLMRFFGRTGLRQNQNQSSHGQAAQNIVTDPSPPEWARNTCGLTSRGCRAASIPTGSGQDQPRAACCDQPGGHHN